MSSGQEWRIELATVKIKIEWHNQKVKYSSMEFQKNSMFSCFQSLTIDE